MLRMYWYGLTAIYVAFCVVGLIAGSGFGAGAALLGVGAGALLASGVATLLNTPERMENAFFSILSVSFIAALVWLLVMLARAPVT